MYLVTGTKGVLAFLVLGAASLAVVVGQRNPKMFLFLVDHKDVGCDDVRIFPRGIMANPGNKIDPIADTCSEVGLPWGH